MTPHLSPSLVFLVQALAIVVLPIAVLRFARLRGLVPLVVIQIFAGIALGPSILGRLAPPEFYQLFVNPSSLSAFTGISTFAIMIFALISGLHEGSDLLRDNGRMFSVVALARFAVPTALGAIAGYAILQRHPEELMPGVSPTEFAIAIGVCTAMTALPVMSAILSEMRLLSSPIGKLALGVAGVNDAVLWIVLNALLAVNAGQSSGGHFNFFVLLLIPVYVVFMIKVVRPLLDRMISARMHDDVVNERALAIVGAVTIASAIATEAIGLHYVIGAFFTGAIMPEQLRKPILAQLQVLTVALLLPFFFTLTGLRTMIDIASPAFLEIFFVTTAVGIFGVVGGAALAARSCGASWSFSLSLGALLQAKGLMELIVLTILVDAKIISNNVFAAMVLMAAVSTTLAMPLAKLFMREMSAGRDPIAGEIPATGV